MSTTEVAKWFADRVIRRHAFPVYFLLELMYVSRRNKRLVKEFTRGEPYRPVWEFDFSNQKTSDTLFLLGSGSSINELTDEHWATIGAEDTLGFNFWPIHEHIPTYYFFELPRDELDHREKIYQLLEYCAEDYTNVPIFFKDLSRTIEDLEMNRVPESLKDHIYMSPKVGIPWNPDDKSSLERSISYLNRLGYFDERDRVEMNFQKRGSLTHHVLLAAMLGYEDIVLLGVDLVDYKYFYTERRDHYRKKGAPIPTLEHLEGEHGTMSSDMGRLPIDEILLSIRDIVLDPRGIGLHIGTKRSALYPALPYYFDTEP